MTTFEIGIRSSPYLADHRFQDMVVVPGSYFIDAALSAYRDAFLRAPGSVRNVTFHTPIILSEHDTLVTMDVRSNGYGSVEYTFYEAGVDDGTDSSAPRQYAARMEVDWNQSTSLQADTDALSLDALQARVETTIDAEPFYATLRKNGNEYGPCFRHVSSIWRLGDQSLGILAVGRPQKSSPLHYLQPSLLDSITQLLAPFVTDMGKTFVLRSIDSIEVRDIRFPDTLWGHATLAGKPDEKGCVGNIRVFDLSGKQYLTLSGVALTLLENVDAPGKNAPMNLIVASNFTAEPLEDSLRFWGSHFDVPLKIEFAPYNQIFQQLLDTSSAFRTNSQGINVILLELEQWAKGTHRSTLAFDEEQARQSFADHRRCVLPNGLEIAHLNTYETDFVYKEIFEDECYLRHGIRLRDGDTVVDIGANIGLFSLFVMSRCANPTIYAFEPAPAVYELLKANCEAYGLPVRASNAGVADGPGTAAFTFYEHSSVFSSFHADEADDREAIQAVVRNALSEDASIAKESLDAYVTELTADRLRRSTRQCRVTSVSEIIRENHLTRINLLKIDAEKSELDIIRGIDDDDWPKIDQIVIEIHDRTRQMVKRIEDLLTLRGFQCTVERERLLEHSGLFNLYAIRALIPDAVHTHDAHRRVENLQRNTRDFCAALRSLMQHSTAPLIVCVPPRTPAAAADATLAEALEEAEETVLSEARTIRNVHTISSPSILRRYNLSDYYDPHGQHLGHMPYTPSGYAAIGTEIVRTIFSLRRHPFKVIVLDCDHTLWRGACGEDGPIGIEVTQPHRALQEFMIHQMKAGMLLCLCSKNNDADVLEVFDKRTDMALKPQHFVSRRVNWNRKSDNIKSLADELDLGLDSFIFIDDNPVECAEVRINCPRVLTLQLPRNADLFPVFLNHIWAFDRAGSTEEDGSRTRMYQEQVERQQFRRQSISLRQFLDGLQLRVEIAEATSEHAGRISQLTFRTNQFNFTTIRRSEAAVRDFLSRDDSNCLVVHVADRFGDYGLVGVLMYETRADRLKVDTLLLSCRVLGKGVEHALISHLGQRALSEGRQFVELAYRATPKNLPAAEFVERIGDGSWTETNTSWTWSAERLAALKYDPDEKRQPQQEVRTTLEPEASPRVGLGLRGFDRSERLQQIGETLSDIGRLVNAIEHHRLGDQSLTDTIPGDAGGDALQTVLLNIWRKVLGSPRLGLNDNFFEAGGTSLKAVQVIATIKKGLKRDLSIVSLFECPTVRLLAARLSASTGQSGEETRLAGAVQRGRQRRYPTLRRQAT